MKSIQRYELRIRRETLPVRDSGEAPETAVSNLGTKITGPEEAARVARALIGDAAQEVFLVFFVDRKNALTGYAEVARGGLSEAQVSPAEVFRTALVAGAAALVLAHNHPSGSAEPSQADDTLTRRLVDGAMLLGMAILDHVIVTTTGFTSMRERGMGGM